MAAELLSSTPDAGAFSMVFLSETVTKAKVLESECGDQIITVPGRVFKHGAMTHLCETITQIVSRATGIELDCFEIESGFQLDTHSMCRALVSATCNTPLDITIAQSVTQHFLQKVKGASGFRTDFLDEVSFSLSSDVTAYIDEFVEGLLQRVGGSAISYPTNVFINRKHIAEFSGKFGQRPDITNTADSIQIEASFDGYWHKKRTVFLLKEDGSTLRANWIEDSDFAKVMQLSNACDALLKITLSVTQDQSGKPVYTLLL